jgi:hypothetical protein
MADNVNHASPADNAAIERGQHNLSVGFVAMSIAWATLTLVLPAMFIADKLPRNWPMAAAALVGYCLLIVETIYTTVRFVLTIYKPSVAFEPLIRTRLTPRQWSARAKRVMVVTLFTQYLKFAYAFALAYAWLSSVNSHAFNVPVGLGTAFYYSVMTIATVGYGDILPVSAIARAIAVVEVMVGLLYAVLVLSVIAAHLQSRPADGS